MKRLNNIFHTIAVVFAMPLLFAGCQEKNIDSYQDDPILYFVYSTTSDGQKDFINQSFFGKHSSQTTDTLSVIVRVAGMQYDYDRPFSVRQVNAGDEDAAIEGLHFVALDNEDVKNSMVVKANNYQASMKIIVNRYENENDPENSLALNTKELELELVENAYFRPGMQPERQIFKIYMTSTTMQPTNWGTFWKTYFGASWGPVKFQFIIDATGYTDWEGDTPPAIFCQWMKEAVAKAFFDYNSKNLPDNPLKEANGEIVTF